MRNLFFSLSLLTMLLASCSGSESSNVEEPVTPPTPEQKLPINISAAFETRATDKNFEVGDKTGLYVVNYKNNSAQELQNSGNHVNNMCFTYNGSWVASTPIYWIDNVTHADFYCYYPYSASISDVTCYNFAVENNQSVESNYKASDFMWVKRSNIAPTPDPVQLNVRHSMSNIIVKLKAGKGYKEEDLKNAQVTISSLKTNSTINLKDGIATATGSAVEITPLKVAEGYKALIVPQTVTNVPLIKVVIDKKSYVLTQSVTFEANKQHTCTVTVNKINGGINIGIDGWDVDDVDHGGVAE